MAIVRTYGNKEVAGLAQKAGENQANLKVAEMQHQANLQQMQQQYESANLDAQLKSNLKKTIIDNQIDATKQVQDDLHQQAVARMQKDWEIEKLQLRSQNDFQLAEKEYTLKKEYDIQKSMQKQVEIDNKIKQLDQDVSRGRIDNTTKRASGLTEYEELYNQITYQNRPAKQSSADAMTAMIMQTLNGGTDAGNEQNVDTSETQTTMDTTSTQSPSDSQKTTFKYNTVDGPKQVTLNTTPTVEIPYTGKAFWKVPNSPFLNRELLKAYNNLPLSQEDRTKLTYLLSYGDSPTEDIQKAKLVFYNKLMKAINHAN